MYAICVQTPIGTARVREREAGALTVRFERFVTARKRRSESERAREVKSRRSEAKASHHDAEASGARSYSSSPLV